MTKLIPTRCIHHFYAIAKFHCNQCKYNAPINKDSIGMGINYIKPKIKRKICLTYKNAKNE